MQVLYCSTESGMSSGAGYDVTDKYSAASPPGTTIRNEPGHAVMNKLRGLYTDYLDLSERKSG